MTHADVLAQREEYVRRGSAFSIWLAAAGAIAVIILVSLTISVLGKLPISQTDRGTDVSSAPSFVGSEACAGCHQAEAGLWRGSQHSQAMAHADDKTVLGDFFDASFDYYNVRSRFFRKDGKFFVETDGPDGTLATFQIKYTFGIDPLQQYLVEFPDGRLQALSIAWDSRPKVMSTVPPLSERGDQARRRPALDKTEPELEFHVCGVPFDRRTQEL